MQHVDPRASTTPLDRPPATQTAPSPETSSPFPPARDFPGGITPELGRRTPGRDALEEAQRTNADERADGGGFSARMRAMRSFEGNDFASDYRRRQADADKQREAFGAGTGTDGVLGRAMRSGVMGGSPKMEANGAVQIDIRNPGPDTKVRTSASGDLFKEVKLSRGKAMAEASQEN